MRDGRGRRRRGKSFQDVAGADEIAPGQSRGVDIAGREVLICNAGGTFYAIDNKCTHADSKLEGGRIRATWISCPLHGARFDLPTGKSLGSVYRPLNTYPTKVENGRVLVEV